ncbi:hypothetical protein FJY71_02210 [candidate division WOR-3 bacterium]|nr:hypothetical protein [candidate division WOR-3 bacterium]
MQTYTLALAVSPRRILAARRMEDDIRPALAGDALLVERLRAIGRLADGLAVDLRQSLSVIRNSIYFLNVHLGETLDEKVRRHLTLMLREVNVTNRIVSNLVWLSARRPPDRGHCDVALAVHAALSQVPVPAGIKVDVLTPPHASVFSDAEMLAAALANLILNSVQAMPEGGRLLITHGEDASEAWLTVSDTGCGMTEEVRRQAGEPLFSTSPQRAGLGLAAVRTLAGANGGRVVIESRPGKGTDVTLRFLRPPGGSE